MGSTAILCQLLAFLGAADLAAKPSVIVLNPRVHGNGPAGAAEALQAQVVQAALESGAFQRVMSEADLSAALNMEEQRQLAGCTDDSCLAELVAGLGADLLLKVNASYQGTSLILAMNLISARDGSTVAASSQTCPSDSTGTLPIVRAMVTQVAPREPTKGPSLARLGAAGMVAAGGSLAGMVVAALVGGAGAASALGVALVRNTIGLQRYERPMFATYVLGWVTVAVAFLAIPVFLALAGAGGVGTYLLVGAL